MYAAMYGIPIATGVPVALWPVHEEIRKYLMENGIQYDDTAVETALEGLQSTLIELATGNDYAASERFGPGGLSILKDIVETAQGQGDKGWLDIIFGPSYSITGDVIRGVEPVIHGLFDVFRTDGHGPYQLMVSDFVGMFGEVSSVNNAARAWGMHNTGRYLSENQTLLDDVDTMDGVIMAILGVAPQEVSDTFLKIESLQDQQAWQDVFKDEAIRNWRLMVTAQFNGDFEAAEIYGRRTNAAIVAGDFRPDQWSQIISDAIPLEPSLVEKINQDWINQAPWSQIGRRQDEYINQDHGVN
jgi:hypothetical protein